MTLHKASFAFEPKATVQPAFRSGYCLCCGATGKLYLAGFSPETAILACKECAKEQAAEMNRPQDERYG